MAKEYLALVAVAGLLLHADVATAQNVTLDSVNYQAGPPATAQPKGNYSTPTTTIYSWQIKIEYGVTTDGAFTPLATPAPEEFAVPSTGGALKPWTAQVKQLGNPPPAGLMVRVSLQRKLNAADTWGTAASSTRMVTADNGGSGPPGGGD